MKSFVVGTFVLLGISMSACGSTTAKSPSSTLRASSIAVVHRSATAVYTAHYRNDGDQDIFTDGDGDNNADVDNDPSLDYKSVRDERHSFQDQDDAGSRTLGYEASVSDATAITATVRRYYADAAAIDGRAGCAMLIPSFARAIPLDYGREGPSYLHARSCAGVLNRLFRHFQKELRVLPAVIEVRTEGNSAVALLGSATMRASEISLQRVSGAWGIDRLLAAPLA